MGDGKERSGGGKGGKLRIGGCGWCGNGCRTKGYG